MNPLVSKITEAEALVMKVLWEAEEELPIAEIRKALSKTSDWEDSTIKTLVRRLCKKGVVKSTKRGVLYYKALVSEDEYNDYITKDVIDRLYSGSAKNLVASLIDNKRLDDSDIEELRDFFKVGDNDE
jgi:BlaI family penicillinase repressor